MVLLCSLLSWFSLQTFPQHIPHTTTTQPPHQPSCEMTAEVKEPWLLSCSITLQIEVKFEKNATGWLARHDTPSVPRLLARSNSSPRCKTEATRHEARGVWRASLRNTGELDLGNTSGRTCFFDSPAPLVMPPDRGTNLRSASLDLPPCRLTRSPSLPTGADKPGERENDMRKSSDTAAGTPPPITRPSTWPRPRATSRTRASRSLSSSPTTPA